MGDVITDRLLSDLYGWRFHAARYREAGHQLTERGRPKQ